MDRKKILFISGTRADFGKLKPLIKGVEASKSLEAFVFVTGMHTLLKYGNTVDEVYKSFPEIRRDNGFRNIYVFRNQNYDEPMEQILANTIQGFSRYVSELKPDMIVIHGDRIEALAGATVGAIRNILVAHIEGGEISGTIDELLRHATSKMSHVHFVSNDVAAKRLKQLGECENSIFTIGSPDIDLMLSDDLPSLEEVKNYYKVPFTNYNIVIFHPVTTDLDSTKIDARNLVDAIIEMKEHRFVVIYPNNDEGSNLIFSEYDRLKGLSNVVILPSMRVEYFLTMLKNASFIIGNSSAGVMEAPVYGVPAINISHRQKNRHFTDSVISIDGSSSEIVATINDNLLQSKRFDPDLSFGDGKSAERFIKVLEEDIVWSVSTQKQFKELS